MTMIALVVDFESVLLSVFLSVFVNCGLLVGVGCDSSKSPRVPVGASCSRCIDCTSGGYSMEGTAGMVAHLFRSSSISSLSSFS